jgi:cobalt-zinc-cadmium resistance protein CzcA
MRNIAKTQRNMHCQKFTCCLIFMLLSNVPLLHAQNNTIQRISILQLVDSVIQNHPLLKNSSLQVSLTQSLTSVNIQPSQITYHKGQLYSATADSRIDFIQPLGSPLQWYANKKYNKTLENTAYAESELLKRQLISKAKLAYFESVYRKERYSLLKSQIQVFSDIFEDSLYYVQNDEKALFEKTMAAYKIADLESQSDEAYTNLIISRNNLVNDGCLSQESQTADTSLFMFEIEVNSDTATRAPANYFKKYHSSIYQTAVAKTKFEGAKFSPEFQVGVFNQSIAGRVGYNGWQIGIRFPLWPLPVINSYKSAKIEKQMAENSMNWQYSQLELVTSNLIAELNKYFDKLTYFQDYSLNSADLIEDSAVKKLKQGLIDRNTFLQSIEMAYKIRLDYIETLRNYNSKAIELEIYAY